MDWRFRNAIESRRDAYLDAEYQIRRRGMDAMNALSQHTKDPDPIAALTAGVLLGWIQGEAPRFQAALDYLEYIPRRFAATPVGFPPPIGVANALKQRFGNGVADFLALRLVKENDWPRWRVVGILFYLKEQKLASTTSALLRFSMETDSEEARGYAIEAIQAIADPELAAKIQLERQRLESRHQTLVTVLESLTPQNGPDDEGAGSPV